MVEQVLQHKLYTIRPGDTLLRIAQVAGVPYEDILALNPQIDNPNVIRAGDMLVLPSAISRQKLLVDTAQAVYPGEEPLWIKIARRELGVAERPGNASNPRILEYLATTSLPGSLKNTDATSWCSAFVNWCVRMAGLSGTNSAWALDWGKWGKSLASPKAGAITVLTRRSASENGGHVGFLLEESETTVTLLGGNQGNAVSIDKYPKAGKKGGYVYGLVGHRWPA